VTGLRERNKAKRRTAILDAAVELLNEQPWHEVTNEQIAARAEVSPATVYNLVGTRERLLTALIGRVLEAVAPEITGAEQPSDGDPLTPMRRLNNGTTAAFIASSVAFRRIVAALVLSVETDGHFDLDPAQLHIAAIREAQRAGVIDGRFAPEALGRQIYVSYLGALLSWAAGSLDDDGFTMMARHGLVTVLAATTLPPRREALLDELHLLTGQAATTAWNPDPGPPRIRATTKRR
jgi:AcrR family transcriptional regulator